MYEKYNYKDIRQSDQWLNYYEHVGWQTVKFGEDISARVPKRVFGSPIIVEKANNINEEVLSELEKYAKEHKAAFLQIAPALTQNTKLLDEHKYEYVKKPVGVTKTGIIDLSLPLNNQFSNLSKNVKNTINRSEKSLKIQIIDNYSNQDVDKFHKIYKKGVYQKGLRLTQKVLFYNL